MVGMVRVFQIQPSKNDIKLHSDYYEISKKKLTEAAGGAVAG